jgi:hypothetical protein
VNPLLLDADLSRYVGVSKSREENKWWKALA